MNPFSRLLLTLGLLIAAVWPAASYATPTTPATYVPGEVVIKLNPGYEFSTKAQLTASSFLTSRGLSGLNGLLRNIGAYEAESIGSGSNTYRVVLRGSADPAQVAARLTADPAVAFAEPNYTRHMLRTPNDPAVAEQWALRNIQAFEAWDVTTGDGVVIAVLDTGVESDHPDLSGKVLPGYNAISNDSNSADNNGHGTAVSGLIAASTDNGTGIAGMCWGCQILPVKVLTARGSGNDATVARGMRWAVDNGARVINMSLGGAEDSQVLREAVNYALSRNVLIIASSGNERQENNAPNYPAAYPGVLAVGATGNTDVVTGFSNTGNYVGITAPGVGLWTTLPGGFYGPPNGTSFASPYVAGAAGLVLTVRGDLGAQDVACVLQASADDKGSPGKDPEYGWGRLNALKALQLAQNYSGCPLSQTTPAPQPDPTQPTPPQPAPGSPEPIPGVVPPAFDPVAPFASTRDQLYFAETGHSLSGEFKRYWERHGGLPIFGYPISQEFTERGDDGRDYAVQYFERYRFELHPDNAPPYNVQLTRMGDIVLKLQGRDWFTFPKGGPQQGCLYFERTGHSLCDRFLSYWRSNGLEIDGRAGKTFDESLALFGQPISEPQREEVEPGVFVTVQWFERARLEYHESGGILLGLLSNELLRYRGWQ